MILFMFSVDALIVTMLCVGCWMIVVVDCCYLLVIVTVCSVLLEVDCNG